MSEFKIENADEPLGPDPVVPPEWFLRYLRSALNLPMFSVPKPFESWMIDRVATSGFDLPISQVVGFTQFTAQPATSIVTSETTTSTSYTNLATTGPELTGLPDGRYLLMYGAFAKNTVAGDNALMSVQVNATAASDDDGANASTAQFVSVSIATTKTLNNGGNNTITAKYRAGANTAEFARRWLVALRYSNV